MVLTLYFSSPSALCRAVLNLADVLGLQLSLKEMDVPAGHHLQSEFIKLNPQHTVPTLNDNGFVLWESRAIMTYLVNKYASHSSLYPKDPKRRALVDQRLYFDMGTMYRRMSETYFPILLKGVPIDSEKLRNLEEAFGFLETFLAGNQWVAGDEMTVADLAIHATVTYIEVLNFDLSKYPLVYKWVKRVKTSIPRYEEINGHGLQKVREAFQKGTLRK